MISLFGFAPNSNCAEGQRARMRSRQRVGVVAMAALLSGGVSSLGQTVSTTEVPVAEAKTAVDFARLMGAAGAARRLPDDGPKAENDAGQRATNMSPVGHEPNDAPIVAMAPHPENQLWWISGQANIILQGDLPFHSPYEGTNSFIGRRRIQDIAGWDGLYGTAPQSLDPVQHRLHFRPGIRRGARSERGSGAGGIYKSGRGAQSQPRQHTVYCALRDSPGLWA